MLFIFFDGVPDMFCALLVVYFMFTYFASPSELILFSVVGLFNIVSSCSILVTCEAPSARGKALLTCPNQYYYEDYDDYDDYDYDYYYDYYDQYDYFDYIIIIIIVVVVVVVLVVNIIIIIIIIIIINYCPETALRLETPATRPML